MEKSTVFFFLLIFSFLTAKSQDTIIVTNSFRLYDTIIVLFSSTDEIKYFPATSEPDLSWYKPDFNDSSWPSSVGAIGFGYGDNEYTAVDPSTKSLYSRFHFNVINKKSIKCLNFVVDYDDGYIAYLNGTEIARVNIDKSITYPAYNSFATRSHSSEYFMRITSPVLGIYLDSTLLSNCLVDGENTMAIHVANARNSDNLMLTTSLTDITHINKKSKEYFYNSRYRYKRLIDTDSTDIPIVVIETDQYGIPYDKSIWSKANMGIISNSKRQYNRIDDQYNEYNGPIFIRLRGQSSRDFSKQSYRLELINDQEADTSFALLGMPKESDWILSGPFADKSQIRNKFVYDLASRMGQYAPRSRFCELVLNGQSVGIYLLTEEVKRDKNRVNISKLTETDIIGLDKTGGYIFKYDKAPHPKGSFIKSREIVYPDPDVLQPEQSYYLLRLFTVYDSILTKTNDFMDPFKGFRKYASDSSLVDFFIINEITKNADSYLTSTYMYKDRDDVDGRIKFGPVWDYDLAFGNTSFQNGNIIEGWQFEYNRSVMNPTRYFQDIEFVKMFQKRWYELRSQKYSNDSILGFFDELVNEISFAQKRNYDIWPVIDQSIFWPGYYMDSYENEIEITRQWIINRLEWIDNNIDKIYFPLVVVNNNQKSSISDDLGLKVYPNPFTDNFTISLNLEETSDIKVQLFDLNGRLRCNKYLNKVNGYNEITITENETSVLNKGIYYIKIIVNDAPINVIKAAKQ